VKNQYDAPWSVQSFLGNTLVPEQNVLAYGTPCEGEKRMDRFCGIIPRQGRISLIVSSSLRFRNRRRTSPPRRHRSVSGANPRKRYAALSLCLFLSLMLTLPHRLVKIPSMVSWHQFRRWFLRGYHEFDLEVFDEPEPKGFPRKGKSSFVGP